MRYTIFEILFRNRDKAERPVEFPQMALSAKFDRDVRESFMRKFYRLFHQALAELVAAIIRRHDNAPDFHRFASLFRWQNSQARCKFLAIENAQVKCLEILAVDLRIRAFLL